MPYPYHPQSDGELYDALDAMFPSVVEPAPRAGVLGHAPQLLSLAIAGLMAAEIATVLSR